MEKPYRPIPIDFRERFIELGWGEIGAHYRAHDRTIARWIEEAGGDELREARSTITGKPHVPARRSARYIRGRTLTPISERARGERGGEDNSGSEQNG
jgi:hypothetical protein